MKNFYSKSVLFAMGFILFASAGCNQPNLPNNDPLIRNTTYGSVKGQADESNTWVWKAIPFAKPPVGNLRWKAPQKPDSWTGIREKTEFCDLCTQYVTDPDDNRIVTGVGGSEDCLYLNIWRPQTDETDLPVHFWVHGGGNSIQQPRHSDLPGANLASRENMVVVSINYRLGPLGWFTHPAIRNGSAYDNSGNYGTLDIILALKWVRDNIQSFGGNPDNVVVAGSSSGATDIFSLLISNIAGGIFHKAIVESTLPDSLAVSDGDKSAESIIVKLLIKDGKASDETSAKTYRENMSGADIREYLRSKSSKEIVECYEPGLGGMISFPNIFADGTVIPSRGFSSLDEGTYPNKVPIIIGSNKEELKLFIVNKPQFQSIYLGTATPDLIELYTLVANYGSDLILKANLDSVARKMKKHQEKVYVYQFLWGYGGADSVIPFPFNYALGACHGIQVDFFFGDVDKTTGGIVRKYVYSEQNSPGRIALSNAIMTYLGNFARTGNPNSLGSGLPCWSEWSNTYFSAPKSILFDADYNNLRIEMSTNEVTTLGVTIPLLLEPRYSEITEVLDSL